MILEVSRETMAYRVNGLARNLGQYVDIDYWPKARCPQSFGLKAVNSRCRPTGSIVYNPPAPERC